MRKNLIPLLIVLLFILGNAEGNVCFGEECKHVSVVTENEPVDPVQISLLIE